MNKTNNAGYYLYGIIKDKNGTLRGITSEVSLAEFGEIPLKKNLESLDWVKNKVLNHERVIEGIMKDTTIIPMKFCTIFKTGEKILELLKEKHDYFNELLERFKGKHEWGVKVYCKRRENAEVKTPAAGREYLALKKQEGEKSQEDEQKINAYVEEVFKKIRAVSLDFRINRPTPKELLQDTEKEQVLNASFLISNSNSNELVSMVKGLDGVELVGPLPVYSFVGDKDEYSK